jgi:hypothetical protein
MKQDGYIRSAFVDQTGIGPMPVHFLRFIPPFSADFDEDELSAVIQGESQNTFHHNTYRARLGSINGFVQDSKFGKRSVTSLDVANSKPKQE